MLIIHPNDITTEFLSVLYNGKKDIKLLTEKDSNSCIRRNLMDNERIMMLGHGCSYGLLSKAKNKMDFNRAIVSPKHVSFLRDKQCIGIWCNANLFAEKYKLKGLFSGMIISELEEAFWLDVETTKEELRIENIRFAENLNYCLNNFDLKDIPSEMAKLNKMKTELTNFNYNNLFFY